MTEIELLNCKLVTGSSHVQACCKKSTAQAARHEVGRRESAGVPSTRVKAQRGSSTTIVLAVRHDTEWARTSVEHGESGHSGSNTSARVLAVRQGNTHACGAGAKPREGNEHDRRRYKRARDMTAHAEERDSCRACWRARQNTCS